MMELSFSVTGLTPLLLHSDDIDMGDILSKWRKDPKNKNISKPGDDRSPPWTWQTYLYHDGTHVCLPSFNLWTALKEAATSITMKGMKSFKNSAAAGIYIKQEFLPIKVAGDKLVPISEIEAVREGDYPAQLQAAKRLGFELYAKRVKVGKSKHLRVRPKFTTWSLSGSMLVTADELTMDVMHDIASLAGRYKGVGDGRPSSGHPLPFGQFKMEFTEK